MKQDNQMEAVLLAYMAGIVDGEGSIGIMRPPSAKNPKTGHYTYHATFGIGMTHRETVELFRSRYRPELKMHVERVPRRKLIYRFRLIGNQSVRPLLKELYPYLRVKKEEARLVLEFCELMENANKRMWRRGKTGKDRYEVPESELLLREEFYWKVRNLKK